MHNWTDEQERALQLESKAVGVSAAAGSGKTAVLVERYLRLLRAGIRANQILTVTFTKEAADQMRDRILSHLREDLQTAESVAQSRWIGTLHSFCYAVLNQYSSFLNLPPIAEILSPFDFLYSFERNYENWFSSLSKEKLTYFHDRFSHRELKQIVKFLYEKRFFFRRYLTTTPADSTDLENQILKEFGNCLEPLFKNLENHFRLLGYYSFSDLEELTMELLGIEQVRDEVVKNFSVILVDEFQDTSPIQWELLNALCPGSLEKLFFVGDPKQSIYRFRNAEVNLFLNAIQQIEQLGGNRIELTTNYRSHTRLIQNINRIAKKLFENSTIPFTPMIGVRKCADDSILPFRVVRYCIEGSEHTSKTRVEAELRSIANEAQLFMQCHPPNSLGILFRVSDRIQLFAQELQRQQIPVSCQYSVSLFEVYDILDIVNFLKFIADPLDDFALAAFLRSPYIGFTYPQLWELTQTPGANLFEKALRQPRLKWIFELIEDGCLDTEHVLSRLFKNSPYFPERCEAFLELLSPLCKETTSVLEMVKALEAWSEADVWVSPETSKQTQGVRLMTVHSAKGLEFDHVWIVDNLRIPPRNAPPAISGANGVLGIRYRDGNDWVETRTYQQLKQLNKQADAEESKRILYVALTRARESLTVFLPDQNKNSSNDCWASYLEEALQ